MPSASHLPTAWTHRVALHSPLRAALEFSWGSLLLRSCVSDTLFQHVLLDRLRRDTAVQGLNTSRILQVPDVTTHLEY